MCGILGFCSKEKNIFYNLDVSGIKNRGPDNVGKYETENIGLYHTRLAIIDNRESSNQPIINRNYVLICNGEVYNYRELRKNLTFDFLTNSDCETIIGVYDTFGIDGFKKLDGMYSFALYDKKNNKLILHRDSIGKKPLYIYQNNKYILFSSNITAIKDNIKDSLSINEEQIKFYLKNKFIEPTKSIYNEIFPLMPGEILEINLNNFDMKKFKINNKFYFDIDFYDFNLVKKNIFKLIKKAIHKRLEGVNTPVILFSGGIDSTILALEAIKTNPNTKLLSLKQPIRFLNDEPYVREFSKKFNKPINFVNILNFDFLEKIDFFISKLDQPFGVPDYYYLSALVNQAKSFDNVLFTGDGADEIFYGYKPFEEWIGNYSKESLLNCPFNFSLSKYGYYQANIALIGHGFVKVDKATAENQMEARNPFLDKELTCFVRQISKEFWENKDIKFILKEYLINEGFSNDYVYRKKIGFSFPFRYMMMLKYKEIKNVLLINKDLLKFYGVNIDNLSYFELFNKFDYYFNLYVLLKFLTK